MFIIWGKKIVLKKLGYVTDFCPICRCVQPFEINNILIKEHLYYISMGSGQNVGSSLICRCCSVQLSARRERYPAISQKMIPFDELLSKTRPDWDEADEKRFLIEKQLKEAPRLITPRQRAELILEPFLILAPKVENDLGATRLDRKAIILFLIAFISTPFFFMIYDSLWPEDSGLTGFVVFFLAIFILVICQIDLVRYRYFLKHVYPVIAKSLLPLRPEEKEIQSAIDLLATQHLKVGTFASVSEILKMLGSTHEHPAQAYVIRLR